MASIQVQPGYKNGAIVTVTAPAVAINGSTSAPTTSSTDYVCLIHLTGATASTVWGQITDQAGLTDVSMWYNNGSSWAQIDCDPDTATFGAWGSGNIALWFKLQANITASGTDNNYMLNWGNQSSISITTKQTLTNIYNVYDDFPGTSLSGSWTTNIPTGGAISVASSAVTVTANNSATIGVYAQYTSPTFLQYALMARAKVASGLSGGQATEVGWRVGNTGNPTHTIGSNSAAASPTNVNLHGQAASTSFTSMGVAIDSANYHVYMVARDSSGNESGSYDGGTVTAGTNPSSTATNLNLRAGNTSGAAGGNISLIVDWVKVRPWLSSGTSEPTTALGTIVTNGYAIVSDAITAAEALTRAGGSAVSDNPAPADSASYAGIIANSDGLSSGNSLAASGGATPSDGLSGTEGLATSGGSVPSDAIVFAESVGQSQNAAQSETPSLGDLITSAFISALADSTAIAGDSAQGTAGVSASDPLSLAESLSAQFGLASFDSPVVIDTLAATVATMAAEAYGISDLVSLILGSTATDALSSIDSLAAVPGTLSSESLSSVELLGVLLSSALSDIAPASDSVAGMQATSIGDLVATGDLAVLSALAGLAETLTLADLGTLTASQLATLILTDLLSAGDALTLVTGAAPGDGLTAADIAVVTLIQSLSEALTLADLGTLTAAQIVALILTDALGVADSAATVMGLPLADAPLVADGLSTLLGAVLVESAAPQDAIVVALGRALAETLGLSDAYVSIIASSFAEAIGLSDNLSAALGTMLGEALSALDAAAFTATGTHILSLADALTPQDSISVSIARSLFDQQTLVDALNSALRTALAEALVLGDQAALTRGGLPVKIGRLLATIRALQMGGSLRAMQMGAAIKEPQIAMQRSAPQVVAVLSSIKMVAAMATGSSMIVQQNDVPQSQVITLTDSANNGAIVDLTGATAATALIYSYPGGVRTRSITRTLTILSPTTAGQVRIAWQTGDFAVPGAYDMDVQIAYGANVITTVTPIPIIVQPLP